MKKAIALTTVVVLALIMAACTTNQVTSTLQTVVATTEVAFPAVAAAANLDPVLTAQINGYLTSVSDAVDKSVALILADGKVTPAQVTQIVAIFAGVAKPNLPAGTPQQVAAVVQAIAPAIEQFLKSIGATPTVSASRTGGEVKYLITLKKPIQLAKADQEKLKTLQARAKVVKTATKK